MKKSEEKVKEEIIFWKTFKLKKQNLMKVKMLFLVLFFLVLIENYAAEDLTPA